jgi:hypothetical protein
MELAHLLEPRLELSNGQVLVPDHSGQAAVSVQESRVNLKPVRTVYPSSRDIAATGPAKPRG